MPRLATKAPQQHASCQQNQKIVSCDGAANPRAGGAGGRGVGWGQGGAIPCKFTPSFLGSSRVVSSRRHHASQVPQLHSVVLAVTNQVAAVALGI